MAIWQKITIVLLMFLVVYLLRSFVPNEKYETRSFVIGQMFGFVVCWVLMK